MNLNIAAILIALLTFLWVVCAAPFPSGLHTSGSRIVDGDGHVVHLHGADRSGTEYACIQGWGYSDGPIDQASIDAMKAWNINAIRVPLNEQCWLNVNCGTSAYCGAGYQQTIRTFVNLITSNGLAAIVELHWSAPGTAQATQQDPMPNADHSPQFWAGVANAFKGNTGVIFDLFNEPFPDGNQNTLTAWRCLLNGGSACTETSRNSNSGYTVAGMQSLVDAVRGTGATNLVMVPGVQYTNGLSNWLAYKPNDPNNNIAASWHSYNFNLCTSQTCWDNTIGSIISAGYPVITGELGENDCASTYISPLMNWLDSHQSSYLAWTWNTWGCSSPALITDYSGTPTNGYGSFFRSHIQTLPTIIGTATSPSTTQASPPPTPVTTQASPPPTPVTTQASPPPSCSHRVLYNETVSNPEFESWSWGSYVNPLSSVRHHSGSYSASIYPCEYNALYFHKSSSAASVSVAAYPTLSFYVWASGSSVSVSSPFHIQLVQGSTATGNIVSLQTYLTATRRWVPINLNVASVFGITDYYDGFWFHAVSGSTCPSTTPTPRLYVDDVTTNCPGQLARAAADSSSSGSSKSVLSTGATVGIAVGCATLVVIVVAVVVYLRFRRNALAYDGAPEENSYSLVRD